MPLTEKQTHLAILIDKHVKQIIKNGGNDEDLLVEMYDMDIFKQLMDCSTQYEMDELCQRYDGFYRFALLLEMLAERIANGNITVPK